MLDPMVAVMVSETRRKFAGDEVLPGEAAVNIGITTESKGKTAKWSWRCGRSPRTCRRGRREPGRSVVAAIDELLAGVGEGNGELAVDWSASGSIPCTRRKKTTRRISRCPWLAAGGPVAAVPW